MKKSELFKRKHELWLTMLFGAFSIKNDFIFDILYDFAMIEYRHLAWLGDHLVENKIPFDYNKDKIDYEATNLKSLFKKIKDAILYAQELYPDRDEPLYARFISDEEYFMKKLSLIKGNEKITAFDKNRTISSVKLDQKQIDALTLFLFEESYKEYELILVYTYSNFFTKSKLLSNIFLDLIYESHFHLKSFARMMREMGILSVPRTLMDSIYQFDDLGDFLENGIKEEEAAKEECLKLSTAVGEENLSSFFNFINYQENYHIELMKKALKYLKEEKV